MASDAPVRTRRPGAGLAAAGAVMALMTDVLYLIIIRSQEDSGGDWPTVPIVASVIFALAVCAGLGASSRPAPAMRRILLAIAASGLLLLGLLAILTIGWLLLIAGALCLAAWIRSAAGTMRA